MPSPTLLGVFRDRAAVRRYSPRTVASYERWVIQFIRFHKRRHPRELGAAAVRDFLTHLAQSRQVAASTQNQALAAVLFLFREVLGVDLPWLGAIERSKKPARLPTVLTRAEAH